MQVQVSRTRVAVKETRREGGRVERSARRSCTRCTDDSRLLRQVKTGLLGKLYQVGSCSARGETWRSSRAPPHRLLPHLRHRAKILWNVTSPVFANLCLPKPTRVCMRMYGARQSRFNRIIMGRVWHRCRNGESCGTSLNSRGTRRSTPHESGSTCARDLTN